MYVCIYIYIYIGCLFVCLFRTLPEVFRFPPGETPSPKCHNIKAVLDLGISLEVDPD